ncbi:unnamed protein product [Meloidogyne enterolobii]|uniref:Uncharacterized protein n=1 Tax=Meloidogyne enterolobii TaxID=390850 RepID=A0ACB0Z387_MELEN
MKLDCILIILTFNAIFWSLINSVKNNKNQNELTRVGETSKENDGAESSVNAQIQKDEKTLNPKPKIAKKVTTKGNRQEEKKLNKSENDKEKRREADRKYRAKNKEKRREYDRKYRENNREKKREYDRKRRENNKEKLKEYSRKYREKRKNKKENLKNVDPKVGNIHSDNNEKTSFVNTQNDDFRNKGKLPIFYEENIHFEEKCLFNQEEEETETHMEEQNRTVVEEPTKINTINQTDSDEEDYLRYLNDKPYDEDEDV